MKTKYIFLLLLIVFTACNTNDLKQEDTVKAKKYNIVSPKASSYLDWYLSNNESIIQYSLVTYPDAEENKEQVFLRNLAPNKITLSDNIQIELHDSYTVENFNQTSRFHIRREALFSNNNGGSVNDTLSVDIRPVQPIYILRPNTGDCHCIPMCYYDQMVIEWNADLSNDNGIIVIAEWDGITMNGDTGNGPIVGIDYIVDDDGDATLNNDLFNGMPNEALVNLWFLRASVVELNYGGDLTLSDFIDLVHDDPMVAQEYLENHPDIMYLLQNMSVGCGAIALLPIYLITDL